MMSVTFKEAKYTVRVVAMEARFLVYALTKCDKHRTYYEMLKFTGEKNHISHFVCFFALRSYLKNKYWPTNDLDHKLHGSKEQLQTTVYH